MYKVRKKYLQPIKMTYIPTVEWTYYAQYKMTVKQKTSELRLTGLK